MDKRLTGFLGLGCLVFTVFWIVFMIWDASTAGPLDTYAKLLAHVSRGGFLYYATYINATLITLFTVAFMAGLFGHCKKQSQVWAIVAMPFLAVYATFNLFVYLSQVLIVPRLLTMRLDGQLQAMAEFFLQQMLQGWQGSAVSSINGLAYGILGIPSIIFGLLLTREDSFARIGGLLLILNGIFCIVGVIGIAAAIPLLQNGILAGGVIFLLALIFLVTHFLRQPQEGWKA